MRKHAEQTTPDDFTPYGRLWRMLEAGDTVEVDIPEDSPSIEALRSALDHRARSRRLQTPVVRWYVPEEGGGGPGQSGQGPRQRGEGTVLVWPPTGPRKQGRPCSYEHEFQEALDNPVLIPHERARYDAVRRAVTRWNSAHPNNPKLRVRTDDEGHTIESDYL